MIKIYARNILRFVLLVLLQVLVFDNIELNGYINPYIYILFIILLPFETPKWLILVLAFALGLTVDLFSMTPGLHAAATVLIAFLRPFILQTFAPRDGYEPGSFPRIAYYGLNWFAKYAFIMVMAHHFFLFSLEIFRLSDIMLILSKTILSGIISTLFIVLSQYFIFRR
ncbi:MAG: rod shape-determining protein MreD [Bacteroidales bacterium]